VHLSSRIYLGFLIRVTLSHLLPDDTIHFSIRQDLYVRMPADLDQFGREYSDGAVVGRKRSCQAGPYGRNGRRLVDQVNPKTRSGKIKRG